MKKEVKDAAKPISYLDKDIKMTDTTKENKIFKISISTRALVEFIFRSGDISASSGRRESDAMQLGTKIHKKIQKSMSHGYTAEVPLKEEMLLTDEEDTISLLVEGRADGIIDGDIATIDEIKSMFADVTRFEEPIQVHVEQAKCYAYIYAKQNNKDKMNVQMTYVNIESEEIKRFNFLYTYEELKKWWDDLIGQYSKWLFWEIRWRKKRDESIKRLDFPFEYRKGQKDFVVGVYKSILRQKKLFVQAPTGSGKTIATVYPAIKAMGEGLTSKLFYLTAKTIARTVAEDTFSLLTDRGLKFRFVTITSKEKICILGKPQCDPSVCERARGHFDRVNDAVFDLLNNEETITRELVEKYAEKHMVCPFEMCLDVSTFSDAIICDYNYVFDPTVSLKRFFAEEKKTDFVFLSDEAHNLLDRAREMYSAVLVKEDILAAKRVIKGKAKRLERALESCNSTMLAFKRECEEFNVWEDISDLGLKVTRALVEYEEYFKEENNLSGEEKDTLLNTYFALRNFEMIHENMGEEYRIYTDYASNGDFRMKLMCMEPKRLLQKRLELGRASVLFSATLLPIKYYKEQLGGTEEDYAIKVPSSFDPSNRLIMLSQDVSSKYTRRNENEYRKIASYIKSVTEAKTGNYFVFFPSYKMMQDVMSLMMEQFGWGTTCEDIILYDQKSGMTEKEKDEFLSKFTAAPATTTIGFCVMGGIFGEGIDLTDDRLIGTLIVGTGLPMVCNENELLKQYYDEKLDKGFEYAYLYPGMNKVMQSAGRVIRTENDKGVILLMDERFATDRYSNFFPSEWFPYENVNVSSVFECVKKFWQKFEGSIIKKDEDEIKE